MKKTYIAPIMKAVELDMNDLIADSMDLDANAPATQSLGMDVKEDNSSRLNSLWDEEW